MPNPCHWTALKRNSQKSEWINQAPIPKRTHEKEKEKDDLKFSWEWIMKEHSTQVHQTFIFFTEIVETFSPKIALMYSHNYAPPELMLLVRRKTKTKTKQCKLFTASQLKILTFWDNIDLKHINWKDKLYIQYMLWEEDWRYTHTHTRSSESSFYSY